MTAITRESLKAKVKSHFNKYNNILLFRLTDARNKKQTLSRQLREREEELEEAKHKLEAIRHDVKKHEKAKKEVSHPGQGKKEVSHPGQEGRKSPREVNTNDS